MITYKVTVNKHGDIFWRNKEGLAHCEHGPATQFTNGTKQWFRNGLYHREDGPAIEYADGYKKWYQNDKLHREDGPAVEYPDGIKYWYLNGVYISEEDHARVTSGKEMSVSEIEKALGYRVKIIKEKVNDYV